MKSLGNLFAGALAVIYFIFPMSMALLILIFMPFVFLTDVSSIRSSGFSGPASSSALIGICGLIIGLSMLIPPLRKMYRVLPWLYPFTKIFYVNLVILNLALAILNYGYQINNAARHRVFYILMIAGLAAGRLAMCAYFSLRPVQHIEGR